MVLRCDTGKGGSAFETSFEVLQKVTIKISVFCDVQSVASAVQVDAIHLLQIWLPLPGYQKTLKINMLIHLLKNVQQPTASMCCRFWTATVGYNAFSKMCVYVKCFVLCYRAQYIISPWRTSLNPFYLKIHFALQSKHLVTNTNQWISCTEIIAIYSEVHTKHINKLWTECRIWNVKTGSIYSNLHALKG